MSAEKNMKDNTSKEVLSNKSDKITGDIYVQDVHKYFGVTRALNGVNFNANFGEIHAIVGGNGCGKSTLAKVMSGVLPIDKGKVSVLGHPNITSYGKKYGYSNSVSGSYDCRRSIGC